MKKLLSLSLAVTILCGVPVFGAQLVRELWEGVGNGVIGGTGDGPTSIGFEPGSTWYLNYGTYIKVAGNFDVMEGTPDTIPGLPARMSNQGGLWGDYWTPGGSIWDTQHWATRQLAISAQIDFAADDVVYYSVRLNNGGDSAGGVGFAAGANGAVSFIGAGFMWNNAGGGSANNSVYITGGALDSSNPYAILANGPAGQVNGKALLVCRLTTSAAGSDSLEAKVFAPGAAVPTDPSGITWDTSFTFADSSLATHLLLWMNGGYPFELDAIRVSRTYGEVVGIELLSQPEILPADTVYAGVSVTVSVSAANAPLTYQWRKGGTDVPGGTNAVLVLSNPVVGDSGSYDVVVSNAYGSVASETRVLTVNPVSPPVVVAEPSPANRYAGGRAVFTVGVDGTPPFSYQWMKNNSPLDGETGASLTLAGVTGGEVGGYSVWITNAYGAVTSAVAQLTILAPASGTYEEAIVTNGPIAYWRYDEEFGAVAEDRINGYNATHTNVWLPVEGPRPASWPVGFTGFSATNVAVSYDGSTSGSSTRESLLNNRGAFTMIGWLNPAGDQANRTGLFGQNDVAEFGYHGTNVIGLWTPGGGFMSFDSAYLTNNQWTCVAAVANGTNIQVYFNGSLVAAGGNITTNYGASAYPFRIGGDGILDATGNSFNGAIDDVALFDKALSVEEINRLYTAARGAPVPPTLLQHPVGVTRYPGTNHIMTVQATGTLPLLYQWQKDGVDLSDGGNVWGAVSNSLAITNLAPSNTGGYRLIVSNGGGAVTSDVADVIVRVPAAGSYEEAVVTNGLVAYWRMNEETGTNAYDFVGGADATHTDVTLPAEGPRPSSTPLAFNGFEPTNAAVYYGGVVSATATGRSLANNRPAFTLMGWVLPAGTQAARAGLFGQNDAMEFGYHDADNVGLWTPGGGYVAMSATNIPVGQWSFLAAVGTGSNMLLYVNGNLAASGGGVTNNYGSSGAPFRIGGGGILDASDNYFYGTIDEVCLYDRALTGDEINRLYAAAAGGAVKPEFTQNLPPTSVRYASSGLTLTAQATGTLPLTFQWQRDGVNLADGGDVSGATTTVLRVTGLTTNSTGAFRLIVSNAGGAVTSDVSTLSIRVPAVDSAEELAASLLPVAYWRLNESGGATAFDYAGGHDAAYGGAALVGVPGPRTPDQYGFEADNRAMESANGLADSFAIAPALNLNTNAMTIACWLYPKADQGGFRGLVYSRSAGTTSGLHFGNGNELRYTWADLYNSWAWDSGLVVPTNAWTFAALVVTPTNATIYRGDGRGALAAAVNTLDHPNQSFGGATHLGNDPQNTPDRAFNGVLDEVALFNRSLSAAEVTDLYERGAGIVWMDAWMTGAGDRLILDWPFGILQSATSVTGAWNDVESATPPYTNSPSAPQEFFRIRLP